MYGPVCIRLFDEKVTVDEVSYLARQAAGKRWTTISHRVAVGKGSLPRNKTSADGKDWTGMVEETPENSEGSLRWPRCVIQCVPYFI